MATALAVSSGGSDSPSLQSYKHQWARYVARKTLQEDLSAVKNLIGNVLPAAPAQVGPIDLDKGQTVSSLLLQTDPVTGLGYVPPDDKNHGKFDVGIVGAGVAGLFTAMVFDWLNEADIGLDITYDIFEAAGQDRVGGRLYTHKFSKKEHDYYDVGAMRFPNNKIMERTFRLFNLLGLKEGKGGLIPYYFPTEDDTVCPSYFNNINHLGNVWKKTQDLSPEQAEAEKIDPFKLNEKLPEKDKLRIPYKFLAKNPSHLVEDALEGFIKDTKAKFERARADMDENPDSTLEGATELWKHLEKADKMSVRQFLASSDNGPDITKGPGYNYNTIEWLETVTYGTGWYDQALTECVLEELDFDAKDWYCVDGGAQTIARLMQKRIKQNLHLNSQVISIDAHVGEREKPREPNGSKPYVPMTLKIKTKDLDDNTTEIKTKDYFTIFNSTTLAALQRMDLKDAGLLWGTRQAIRALGYGASAKVAIKFSDPWWQKEPFNINEGGLSRTDLPLRVCVYPSYNLPSVETDKSPNRSAVLLCSYTWGQDAQRIGSLVSSNSPDDEEELKTLLLHNLALLHQRKDKPYQKLLEELNEKYVTHHAYDWYRDQNMSGAFAYFGPGQFSNMWQEIIKPNAFGQLYLIGEAASSHHAWIVGALESVIRAVYLMFEGLNSEYPDVKVYQDAMDLLKEPQLPQDEIDHPTKPTRLPTGSPFHPLPEEMPNGQKDTPRSAKLSDNPANEENLPLNFPAAIASLSLIESYFELVYGVKAATPESKPTFDQQQPA